MYNTAGPDNDDNDMYFGEMEAEISGDTPLVFNRSNEYASRIMDSIETGDPTIINGNVPNHGLISNLGDGSCVEVPCLVDNLGIHPLTVGELPPQLAALNRSNIAVQELAVQAVLQRDKDLAKHAVMLDPLTAAILPLGDIEAMFDEMWEAHAGQLNSYM